MMRYFSLIARFFPNVAPLVYCMLFLVFIVFLFTMMKGMLRNKWLLIGFSMGLFVFGIYFVYWDTVLPASNTNRLERLAHSADMSISSFFLSRGDGLPKDATYRKEDLPKDVFHTKDDQKTKINEKSDANVNWLICYYLFHLGCVLCVFLLGTRLFGVAIFNEIRLACRLFPTILGNCLHPIFSRTSRTASRFAGHRETHVFWGETDRETRSLARSIQTDGTKRSTLVYAIPVRHPSLFEQQDTDLTRTLSADNELWVYARPDTPGPILRQGRFHYFLNPDWKLNVERASALVRKLKSNSHVYVRIGESADSDILYQWADSVANMSGNGNPARSNTEIHVVREESLVSKSFLWKHPMSAVPGIEIDTSTGRSRGKFRLLLVGYGAQGKELLNDMVCDAQLPGTSFSADIVDALEQSYASFKASAPDAVREYNLDFKQCDVRSGEFWEWLDAEMEKHGPWNRVVVAMQDDSVNFRLATEMSRRYLERGVKLRVDEVFFVRVRSDETEMRIHSMRKLGLMPSSFGCLSSIYTKATVVDEQQDRAAEYRNWLYRHTPTDQFSHADWLNTSMFDKESSRASAFGIRTILRLAGFCWNADARAFEPIPGNSRSLVAALESPKLKENLAESEHNRWMAFLLMRGIKRWNLNDPTQENVEELAKSGYVKANRQKQMRRHAALVPYGKILQEVADAIDAANKKAANRLDKDGNPEPSRIATDDAKTVSEILKVIAAAGWVVDDGATTTKDTP